MNGLKQHLFLTYPLQDKLNKQPENVLVVVFLFVFYFLHTKASIKKY